MERASVEAWIANYEQAWRRAGVEQLADLFTTDCSYLASPWSRPIEGLAALGTFWEAERDGPEEPFTMHSEVLAVDDDVAIARIEVDYDGGSDWRDLWVMRFGPDGRCKAFEEWPFAPDQADGH